MNFSGCDVCLCVRASRSVVEDLPGIPMANGIHGGGGDGGSKVYSNGSVLDDCVSRRGEWIDRQ